MKKFTSNTQKIGELGENIACKFLVKRGFTIIDRNFTCKLGEIDVIAEKGSTLHFVEVKSMNMVHMKHGYRAEENVTLSKMQKIHRTVEIYLHSKKVSHETIAIDVLTVTLDTENKKSYVKLIENVIM